MITSGVKGSPTTSRETPDKNSAVNSSATEFSTMMRLVAIHD